MDAAQLTTAARSWLGIPDGATGPDVDALALIAPAVVGWVAGLPAAPMVTTTNPDGTTTTEWASSTTLGAVMLTGRLVRRRNSPAGVEAFGADGVAYVQRTDPDVAVLLRIGTSAPPRTG